MRAWMIALTAAGAIAVVGSAAADDWDEDPFDRYEQEALMRAERDKARKLGGYNDPFTALKNLFSGEADDRDVTRGIHDLQAVPGHEGVPVNRRDKP